MDPDWVDVFPIKKRGIIPASYVRLPEGSQYILFSWDLRRSAAFCSATLMRMAAKKTPLEMSGDKDECKGKKTYPLVNIAGWNIIIFNRTYIFHSGPFSIAMLDYRTVREYTQI